MTPTELLEQLGLTVACKFISQSQSRYPLPKGYMGNGEYCINWTCTLSRQGKKVIETPYTQGVGHLPVYQKPMFGVGSKVDRYNDDLIKKAYCEYGDPRKNRDLDWEFRRGNYPPLIPPKVEDIMFSLLMDGEAADYTCFEEWANEFGYDSDSIKANNTYQECLKVGLTLRAKLGDDLIGQLREAFQGY